MYNELLRSKLRVSLRAGSSVNHSSTQQADGVFWFKNKESDNLITRINYSERAKGGLALAFLTLGVIPAYAIDVSTNSPEILAGHVKDFLSIPLGAALIKTILGSGSDPTDTYSETIFASGYPVSKEIFQFIGLDKGVFDPGDFIAFGIGAAAWICFDRAAKALYRSGITKPFYKLLCINDRRISPTYTSSYR